MCMYIICYIWMNLYTYLCIYTYIYLSIYSNFDIKIKTKNLRKNVRQYSKNLKFKTNKKQLIKVLNEDFNFMNSNF